MMLRLLTWTAVGLSAVVAGWLCLAATWTYRD